MPTEAIEAPKGYEPVDQDVPHTCTVCADGEHFRRIVRIPPEEVFRERAQHMLGTRRIRHRVGPVFSIEGSKPVGSLAAPAPWYDVDLASGSCSCPWSLHHPTVTCKHRLFFEALRDVFLALRDGYGVR